MKHVLFALLVSLPLAAVEPGADPLNDRLRSELALTQRDFLLIQKKLADQTEKMRSKTEEAQKLCAAAKKDLDAERLVCVAQAPAAPTPVSSVPVPGE